MFVFHSSYVCRQYEIEFVQLRHGLFGRGLHGDVPKTYDLAGIPTKILFAPDHTPELEIIGLIKQYLEETPTGLAVRPDAVGARPDPYIVSVHLFATLVDLAGRHVDQTEIAPALTVVKGELERLNRSPR